MIGRYRFLPKALWMAAKSGRFGPGIFEHEQFANHTIRASEASHPWKISKDLYAPDLSQGLHKKLRTTALLVIEGDQIIAEAYANGGSMTRPSNSFSMAKSVVATVVAMCFKQNLLQPGNLVRDLLPDLHPRLKDIRLQDLLQMTTGLDWDESPSLKSDNALAYYGNTLTKQLLALRSKSAPGQEFEYVSVASQLLSACILSGSGRAVEEWVSTDLWPTLGCEYDAYWNLDRPGGQVKAFCCLYATARDFARLGRLYLTNGQVQGSQLIDSTFVKKATRPHDSFDPYTGRQNDCYGWHWWTVTHQDQDYFYARGIRGQYIICSPDQDRMLVRLGHRRLPVSQQTGHPPDLYAWLDILNAPTGFSTS